MTLPNIPRPEYEAVFDSAPGNYLLLAPDFTIVGVNAAYLAATMTRRESIIGRGLFDVFPDNPDDPSADGVRNLRASLLRVLEHGKPDRMAVQKYDIRRPDTEGGGFEERYWSPVNTPVIGLDGTVRWIIHWVEDVTEFIRLKDAMRREQAVFTEELQARASQIEAEAFLRTEALEANQLLTESERRYRFLADAVPQLIWTAEPDGRLDYVNEQWLSFSGLSRDQLLGDGWHQTLYPEDRDRVVSAWREAVRAGADRHQVEHRLRHHDGTVRWMLTTALPYRAAGDGIEKWFGTTTDIHARVEADEQMRQAYRLQAVGKLAGGMAHEVNNMMSAVLGFGELVLAKLSPDHPQRRDIEEMVKSGQRAAEVTRQLLAFSRQQVLKPDIVDVNAVVGGLVPTLERLLGSDRRLDVVTAEGLVRVRADRSQIEQVLINLVVNARDATVTNGLVVITTEAVSFDATTVRLPRETDLEPGRFVRISVRDNGNGMPPEVAARIFEPFFTTKGVGQGTGLGLSMVYGIVRQSGGFIDVDSLPGAGTTMAVHLPLVEAELAEQPEVQAAPLGKGERILVVEDEPVVRSLVVRILEERGYRVYQAPNGMVALEFLTQRQGDVDLVLTDIVMPRINGRELAETIGKWLPDLPVLFMSGYSGDEILQRGLSLEGVAFVPKPITADRLATAVRARLEQANRLRDQS